jgi:oxalate decarboxylase
MKRQPGVMRELHWRADTAERAFVISCRVCTTLVDPAGRSETNDFQPGDGWYFPCGHGRQLESRGNEPCHFILIFDNGYFSGFGTCSITEWMAQLSASTLAKSLGVAGDMLRGPPTGEVYFAKGAIPPGSPADPISGPNTSTLYPQVDPVPTS